MKYGLYILSLVGVLALVVAPHTQAAVFLNEENNTVSEAASEDAYIVGNINQIKGSVDGDLFTFGNTVTVDGAISQDIYTGAQTISITGDVGDDIHAAGNTITLESAVTGDAFVAGQSITMTESASVGNDVYAAGAQIIIAGAVEGDVRASGNVTIASTARVSGDVIVVENEDAPVIEEGAQIGGEVRHTSPQYRDHREPAFQSTLSQWVRQIVTLFVLTFLFNFLFPGIATRLLTAFQATPGKNMGVGFLWVLLFIPVFILFLVTIIGIPLAILTMAITIIGFILSCALAALFLGTWLMSKISPGSTTTNITWTHILLGATAYHTIQLIPFIGWIITALLALTALGTIFLSIIPRKSTPEAAKV